MIKKFENFKEEQKYKVGDYVFIKNISKHLPLYKKLVKISRELSEPNIWLLQSIEDDLFVGAWSSDRIRKATKKEISDYMLKINREKYNI